MGAQTALNKGTLSSEICPYKGNDSERAVRFVPFMRFKNNLKALRKDKGWTQEEAAVELGLSLGGYRKLEYGDNRMTTDTIQRAAKAYRVSQGEIVSHTVPIVGLAGAAADGSVVWLDAGNLGDAPMPPGGNERTVALEVRGESMRGIAENGWLIYYDDRREPLTDDLLGELCVVGLSDGRTLVKTPHRGRSAGRFDLESTNAGTLRDVEVEWAAAVTAIVPQRTARKLVRGAA